MMSPAAAVIGRCCENYWRLLHECPAGDSEKTAGAF